MKNLPILIENWEGKPKNQRLKQESFGSSTKTLMLMALIAIKTPMCVACLAGQKPRFKKIRLYSF